LLTAVGLSPSGSITVHIYRQTINRTTQITTEQQMNRTTQITTEQHKLRSGSVTRRLGTRTNQELQALYIDLDIVRGTGNKRSEWVGH